MLDPVFDQKHANPSPDMPGMLDNQKSDLNQIIDVATPRRLILTHHYHVLNSTHSLCLSFLVTVVLPLLN